MDRSLEIFHSSLIMLKFIPSNLFTDKSYFIKIFFRSSGLTNFSHSCVPIGSHLKTYSAPIIAKHKILKFY